MLIKLPQVRPEIRDKLVEFRRMHQDIGARYLRALDLWHDETRHNIHELDRSVRGIDREPMRQLDQVLLTLRMEADADMVRHSVTFSRYTANLSGLSGICFALCIVVVAFVLVDRTRHEDRLREATDRADQANRTKSRFLAHMSHEIRTPMNGITANIDLLQLQDLPEQAAVPIRVMERSAETLLTIVDDILDLSKFEAQKLELRPRRVRLDVLSRDIGLMVRPLVEKKGLKLIEAKVPEGLPEVMVDDIRLKQIMLNLCNNAIKFTDRGEIRYALNAVEEETTGAWKITGEVTDTGIGISEEKAKLLFEPFIQVDDSLSRRYQGTGLGLAICRMNTRAMGGTIEVESKPRSGSRFFFHVMGERVPGEQLERRAEGTEQAPDSSVSELPRLRSVLLAEDIATNRLVATKLLQLLGLECDQAHNGREALLKARKKPYDLILMDCEMPVMDGYEATRQILQEGIHPGTIIIAMTAHAMEENRRQSFEAGMHDHISKPLRLELIRETLSRHFRLT